MENLISFFEAYKVLVILCVIVLSIFVFRLLRSKDKKIFTSEINDLNIKDLMYLVVLPNNVLMKNRIFTEMNIKVKDFFSTQENFRGETITRPYLFAVVMIHDYKKSKELSNMFDFIQNKYFLETIEIFLKPPIENLGVILKRRKNARKVFDLRDFSVKKSDRFIGIFSEDDHLRLQNFLDEKFLESIISTIKSSQDNKFIKEFNLLEDVEKEEIKSICKTARLEKNIELINGI